MRKFSATSTKKILT